MDLKQELYDVCGMSHVPFWQKSVFHWFLLALGLVIAFWVVWYLRSKVRAKKNVVTAWDQALSELRELQKRNVASAEHGKEFYHALTALMKRYLHDRFGFSSVDKTDDELIGYLLSIGFSPDLITLLRSIFDGAVSIKFANARAVQEQIDQAVVACTSFIKATIPVDNNQKD